ncbi:hypothetical protein BDV32DRAFT_154286 [Aspergillus pseudonomiae]|uniref:Uncharacterized protein n=1 Tax=Aspergillus pseudonomiae TaxID=1506151 RepID=A0A5N7CT76_9EURO|nr:uncharacterized protein BDV37DRAFT_289498 [Aspergillus pseudonomiae]KAB8255425.1 hypothetical protein BDV32DRAFT_154286 [Aspergillus pseudonomiae]KAE8397355.1 hypothetical protein BDV37DRAFT_289498 [Aspergillus pseudonomiae]
MRSLPREILDNIAKFLSPFQVKAMGDSFGFVDENQSHRLWRAIFKDEVWLKKAIGYGAEPVLIGSHINDVAAQTGRKRPVYIVLHTNDFSGDTFHDGMPSLLQSLRNRHSYNEKTHEVTLPKISWRNAANEKLTIPKIILNVYDIAKGAETMELEGKKTRKLFEKATFTSKYSFYTCPKIQTLERKDIYGIGGAVSEISGLTPICVFNLRTTSKKWQIIFCEPGYRGGTPYYEGEKYKPHTILGWRR